MSGQPTVVLLGNVNPMHHYDGVLARAEHLERSVSRAELLPDVFDADRVAEALSTDNDRVLSMRSARLAAEHRERYSLCVHELEDALQYHSRGVAPAWVSCPEDQELEAVLAGYFGCARGEQTMLQTNVGRDDMHAQHLSSGTQPAAYVYGALSTDAGAGFAGTDTVLAGELSNAGGGLNRAAMTTYVHTAGTNVSTWTRTWTKNASDPAGLVTVQSFGLLNAASAGDLGYERPLSSSQGLTNTGDSSTITFTWNGG